VGVDVTVSGSRAVVVGAEIADQFRALATALAEQAESAEIVVSATLLLGGGAPAPAPAPRTAGLQVLPAPRSVLLDGEHVEFTRREFDLLLFLARQPGRVHTRSQLLQSVWGHAHISGERTVDVHIRRIRFKLRAHQSLVTTVRGVGYRFDGSADVVAEENAVL
jgi:DNA-binding response OmpR family regulator